MLRTCTVQAFHAGRWHEAARIDRLGAPRDDGGRRGRTALEYDPDYAASWHGRRGCEAVSMVFPVGFELHLRDTFPAFAIDLLPQGEARRLVVARLTEAGMDVSDWAVLTRGAGNPVGNLRIAEAATAPATPSPGVPRDDVVRRGDGFRAWADAEGIDMTGSSDTAGASPKLLLTEDANGLLHADGALPDPLARRHFIVKFPRGRTRDDARVLANEAPYLEVVRGLGLRCGKALSHHDEGVLFVPRFDRQWVEGVGVEGVRVEGVGVEGAVERCGMESAYALLQVVEAGARLPFARVCAAFHAVVDHPTRDVIELVLRDAAALALGNPDNHGRNTSLLKHPDGRIELSPVYDFAPMVLDPERIRRQTRWRSETPSEQVDWNDVCDELAPLVDRATLAEALRAFAERLAEAPRLMRDEGVDARLIADREPAIRRVADDLKNVEG